MPWRKPLPLPIKLDDGRVLETLLDLGNLLTGDTFAGVTRSPALEHALQLLLKASETGDPADIHAAADQTVIVLDQRKLLR